MRSHSFLLILFSAVCASLIPGYAFADEPAICAQLSYTASDLERCVKEPHCETMWDSHSQHWGCRESSSTTVPTEPDNCGPLSHTASDLEKCENDPRCITMWDAKSQKWICETRNATTVPSDSNSSAVISGASKIDQTMWMVFTTTMLVVYRAVHCS